MVACAAPSDRTRRKRAPMGSFTLVGGGLVLAPVAMGCMPAGTFTDARTLPRGAMEHMAALEIPVSHYERRSRPPGGASLADPRAAERSDSSGGPVFLYGLKAGIARRVEIGATVGGSGVTLSGEVNAKINVLDGAWAALAIAPRVAMLGVVSDHASAFYYFRLPLLFTVEPTRWLSITPRAGVGLVRGTMDLRDFSSGAAYFQSGPFAEAGLTFIIRVSRFVGLALEGYGLTTLRDTTMASAGGGVGVLVGPRRGAAR